MQRSQKIWTTETFDFTDTKSIYNGTKTTFKKCEELAKQGFRFVPGNNPYLNETVKWTYFECIRVAQTNSRNHGKSIQTLWAVKIRD